MLLRVDTHPNYSEPCNTYIGLSSFLGAYDVFLSSDQKGFTTLRISSNVPWARDFHKSPEDMGSTASKIAAAVSVSPKAVRALYDALKRENGSKYLSGICYDSPQFSRLVQRAIDTNRDGKIGIYEYVRFLMILQSPNRELWLEELFRAFDANQDEYISREEVRNMFAAADQMKHRENNQQRADNFFRRVDSNGDGRLSRKEFVDSAKADSSIMRDLEEIRSIMLEKNTTSH